MQYEMPSAHSWHDNCINRGVTLGGKARKDLGDAHGCKERDQQHDNRIQRRLNSVGAGWL